MAEAVLARRQAVLYAEEPPEIHLVIGETALCQQVGDEAVMDEQIAFLAQTVRDNDALTVQILPFESGAHTALGDGSMAIPQFTGVPGLGLVHLGGIAGGVCLEGQGDLAAYTRAFEQLRAFASGPVRSARQLRILADA